MTRRPSMLGALGERQFRLLWIGQTASAAGDALLPVAIAFAVLRIGGSAFDLGIVFAAFTVAHVALVLAGGVWADRLPRQLVMVACDVVRGVGLAVLAILLISGRAQIWHLAVGTAVIGAASAFFLPASSGLVPQTVSPVRLQQANALMSLSRSATGIFGPPISGVVIVAAGTGAIFLIDAATFAASAMSLLLLRLGPTEERPTQQPFFAELAAGWHEVTSRPWILAAICTFGITNLAASPFYILGAVVADQKLGGAAAWGLILTGSGIGGLIGGLLALRLRPKRPLFVGFLISSATSLPLIALVGPAPVLVIAACSLVSLVAIELSNTWWFTMLQQHVPEHARSRVSSYDWLVSLVFQPLGFILAGPLANEFGLPATLLGAAGLVLAGNLGVLLVRAVRDVRWVEAPADVTAGPG
jgi:predicted MFS family arabinose efflux permease